MSSIRVIVFVASVLILGMSAWAEEAPKVGSEAGRPAEVVAEKCEHGVKTSICTRCNPKLAAVFKAKNDWCAEHARAESQCVICHPDLSKQGVK